MNWEPGTELFIARPNEEALENTFKQPLINIKGKHIVLSLIQLIGKSLIPKQQLILEIFLQWALQDNICLDNSRFFHFQQREAK